LGLPFEQEIISQLWPNVQVVNPPKLELYQQLFESHVDLVWLYKPIEGVEAEFRGIPLKYFTLEEASVPYGHAPLLVTSRQFIQTHPRELRRLMEVSSRGYLYAAYNLQETIEILFALHVPGMRDRNLLKLQLQALKPYWLNEDEQWGVMNPGRWHKFYEWLHFHSGFQLSETQLETCFTNQFLQYSVIKA
jgi:ABC-type nitrate/sulfonate/bicarbonate transport system substrate-binding protein